jgi:hypothetical protein
VRILFKSLGAPFLQGDILDSYKSVPPGNLAWSLPVQNSTSKIASLAFWEIECRVRVSQACKTLCGYCDRDAYAAPFLQASFIQKIEDGLPPQARLFDRY